MLYISPAKAVAEIKDDISEEWLDDLRIELDDFESTIEELYVKLYSEFFRDLAIQSLANAQHNFQLNVKNVLDRKGEIVYQTLHAAVQGVATDAEGRTVFLTTTGPITVLNMAKA